MSDNIGSSSKFILAGALYRPFFFLISSIGFKFDFFPLPGARAYPGMAGM